MIYTCTIAPSIDYTVYLPEFEQGMLNRSNEVFYYPGGKGINVSRVLQRLGVKNVALGFAGGFTGNYITEYLATEGIITDFIDTEEITRINIKLKSNIETEINGSGPNVKDYQLDRLILKMRNLSKGDSFLLAGSLPASIPFSFFEKIAKVCDEREVHFIVDSSGPQFKKLIEYKPFLIKPNQDELAELFNTSIETQEEVVMYAKKLIAKGVSNVIVSLGGSGAIYVTNKNVYIAGAPKGEVVNTVGAGDSLVAGFLAAYTEGESELEAFRLGVASGSATAFTSDLCERQDVQELLENVHIKKLD